MSRIVLIDYGAGNLRSVKFALNRLGIDPIISKEHDTILGADKVVFPGVGEARSAMNALQDCNLIKLIPQLTQPVLGVCLGMQLLCASTEERDTEGLGVIPLKVERIREEVKVPHMGWNQVHKMQGPLFDQIEEGSYMYFVHSYRVPASSYSIASTDYGARFAAAIQKDNFYGCQFHPEKSGSIGQVVLQNFLAI